MNRIHSIIEGTQAALGRLGLDYVDVLFAHRPDSSGTSISMRERPPVLTCTRSADGRDCARVQLRHREGLGTSIYRSSGSIYSDCRTYRRSTGLRPSGRHSSSRRHSVRRLSRFQSDVSADTPTADVADKLNLVGPIAEQCQHQYVLCSRANGSTHTYHSSVACSIASVPRRNTRKSSRHPPST